jgi:chemotaxis protein histidine kinase CheA
MNGGPQAQVDLMKKVFLGRLQVRFDKMNEALAQCHADPADDVALTELHRLLHSLAGAAGTFGFDAMGGSAKALELRVKELLGKPVRNAADLGPIGAALNALQSTT